MTIRLVDDGSSIVAQYTADLGRPVTVDLSIFQSLGPDARRLLQPIIDHISRLRRRSAVNYFNGANDIGKALNHAAVRRLPDTENDWQNLVLTIHRRILTSPESRATLKTRVGVTLPIVNKLLSHLQDEGVIPLSVFIPASPTNFGDGVSPSARTDLIGEEDSKPIEVFNSQLICDISLSRTDADYLDYIRDTLTQRRQSLRKGLIEYWEALKIHVVWGRNAIERVDADALLKRLNSIGLSDALDGKWGRGRAHYCTPDTADGLERLLALLKYTVGGVPTELELRNVPHLPRLMIDRRDRLYLPPDVTSLPNANGTISHFRAMRLRWFLGRLAKNDIAVLSALIIMEHPSFTPEAITHARLFDRHGKRYIELGDKGARYSVQKHRARTTKKATLSPLTLEIIEFIASLAPDVRQKLRVSGGRKLHRNGA